MYLVTSLATRAKTAKHGITQTNELVSIGGTIYSEAVLFLCSFTFCKSVYFVTPIFWCR